MVPEAQELRANLAEWMKPVAVTGGFVQQKPLGVVGVVGAWNFPLSLTLTPALDALAAGNRVILKFPDPQVRTGIVLAKAVATRLTEDEVAVVLGDIETARQFSDLALDHIVFTGSPAIGKVVAAAAARNLVPVTLELGGKNPAVVARDADLALAAHRIAGTRILNGGQICLCADYVLVPSELRDEFVAKLVGEFRALFPAYLGNPGVVSIVNDRNYDRITGLLDDAVAKGAPKLQAVNEQEKLEGRRAGRLAHRGEDRPRPRARTDHGRAGSRGRRYRAASAAGGGGRHRHPGGRTRRPGGRAPVDQPRGDQRARGAEPLGRKLAGVWADPAGLRPR